MKIKNAIIVATILVAIAVSSVITLKKSTPLYEANVEALADGETGLDRCAGCSTDKTIFCCHLIIVDLGGWFLYKD